MQTNSFDLEINSVVSLSSYVMFELGKVTKIYIRAC